MEKKSAADRAYPRQVKMTDDFYATACAVAKAGRKSFSEYVRDLIAADVVKSRKHVRARHGFDGGEPKSR